MKVLERLEGTLAGWVHWGFVAWLGLSAGADTWVVDRLEDAGDGSLRWAIEQANARPGEDRIQVTVEGRSRLAAPLPALSGNTVIVGPGRDFLEISGDGTGRVFSTAVGTTNTISALTIANGRLTSGENGAGILNLGSLVLSNCVLTGNHASNGFGGAIYSTGDLTVVGCRIAKNSVIGGRGEDGGGYDRATGGGGGGGGGGGLGGGLFSASGRLLIADSEFDQNSATGGEGGRTNASVRVGGRGGGLNGGIGGDVTLPGADGGVGGGGGGGGSNAPRGPRSGGNGGLGGGGGGGGLPANSSPSDATAGVSEFGGGPGAEGVVFFNSATRPGVGGGGGGLGGALFVLSGEATVSRSRFGQNQAIGGAGGRLGPAVPPINRFSGGGYGGAVFGNEGTLEIFECTFRSNLASSVEGGAAGGGAVFIRSATTSVDSSTFHGNSAAGADGTDRGGLGQGGAVMAWSGPAKIVNCTFSDNLALGGLGRPVARQVVGTGGEAYGGALMVVTSRVDLVHCTLTRNGVRGGSNSGGDPSFYPTEIIGTALGGGFANSGGLLTLRNTLVDGNGATRYFTGSDGFGPIVSEGVNLIGISKDIGGLKPEDVVGRPSLLRSLDSDGGPTPTHVPLNGSPAVDAASMLPEVAVDQRGVSRPGDFERILALSRSQPWHPVPWRLPSTDSRCRTVPTCAIPAR